MYFTPPEVGGNGYCRSSWESLEGLPYRHPDSDAYLVGQSIVLIHTVQCSKTHSVEGRFENRKSVVETITIIAGYMVSTIPISHGTSIPKSHGTSMNQHRSESPKDPPCGPSIPKKHGLTLKPQLG